MFFTNPIPAQKKKRGKMADAYQTYDYKAAGFNVSALKINEIRSILGKEGVHMPQGCKKVRDPPIDRYDRLIPRPLCAGRAHTNL